MLSAPIPEDDAARLASLRKMNILFTPTEEVFDRITRVAQHIFQVPGVLISIVDEHRQWFKSRRGIAPQLTQREYSFCGHAICNKDIMVVKDASKDSRFADNPLVSSETHVRFYAGRPLHNNEGYVIGTLCLIDQQPRHFTAKEMQVLDDLGHWVETAFTARGLSKTMEALLNELDDAKRESLIDPLLRTWNRTAIMDILSRENDHANRENSELSILMLDVDRFKSINDQYGHPVGDAVLIEVVQAIRNQLRSYDSVGRYGGEEFMVVLPDAGEKEALKLAERLRRSVETLVVDHDQQQIRCTISIGVKVADTQIKQHIDEIVMAADQALLSAKNNGRNRVELAAA
ncbi:MAG TPA: sensor domain-containing diguanylate cyclase [Methylophilaceae bacterium]|nr:sensor domain-containing diguanylate cyclase [Methylophilaceae bacterium]